jgi:hypothetical protein
VFKPSIKSIYGCTWAQLKQKLGVRDYHLQITVMADGDDLYIPATVTCFFLSLPHLHFEVKICNPTNKISVALFVISLCYFSRMKQRVQNGGIPSMNQGATKKPA